MATADATPVQVGGERFALLDSLRGAAALAVMGIHLGYHSGLEATVWGGFTARLNVGVTLFFLLSGFLLYRPWARAVLGLATRPRVASYAWKRFLRIVPAYWVALSVFAATGLVQMVWTPIWWVYYGFLQAWQHEWFWGGIGPAWSLSTEMTFYAVLPLLGALMLGITRGCAPRSMVLRQAFVLLSLGLLSVAFRAYSFDNALAEFNQTILSLFLWFAAGMVLAIVHVWRGQSGAPSRLEGFVQRHPGVLWAVAGVLYVWMSVAPVFPRSFEAGYTRASFVAEHVLYMVISLLLMLPAIFGEHRGGWPRRVLASPTLSWTGLISYGVFLWHEPLVFALARNGAHTMVPGWPLLSLSLAAVPPVLLLAWLSYRFVEAPALRLKSRVAGA